MQPHPSLASLHPSVSIKGEVVFSLMEKKHSYINFGNILHLNTHYILVSGVDALHAVNTDVQKVVLHHKHCIKSTL